jgi:hypothetical protein
VRKKRRDKSAQKGLTNLTVAVDAMGVVSTDGQCLLKAPLVNDTTQTEAEEPEEERGKGKNHRSTWECNPSK